MGDEVVGDKSLGEREGGRENQVQKIPPENPGMRVRRRTVGSRFGNRGMFETRFFFFLPGVNRDVNPLKRANGDDDLFLVHSRSNVGHKSARFSFA